LLFVTSTISLITSMYSLFLNQPTKTSFALFGLVTILSFPIAILSLTLFYCQTGIQTEKQYSESICFSLDYRTQQFTSSCQIILKKIHTVVFESLGFNMTSIQIFDSLIILATSLIQLFGSLFITIYSAKLIRLPLPKVHLLLALVPIFIYLLSILNSMYCCTFYYTNFYQLFAVWVFFQHLASYHYKCHGQIFRVINAIGVFAALSFAFISLISLICWHSLFTQAYTPAKRFCEYPKGTYSQCYRKLMFTSPYIHWTESQIEIMHIQFTVIIASISIGTVYFLLSMKFAFFTNYNERVNT
uniref:MARVEL domain-containing protein n=1 Tax=Rhabditophanes sp. KR3021 TaxID=114890 RepID=A0AC35UFB8_9BILA